MIVGASANRVLQLLILLTRYQTLTYGRSHHVQGLFLCAVVASSGVVATGVRSDWLASEVVTWGSLFVMFPATVSLLVILGSTTVASSEHFLWNHILPRGISRSLLFASRYVALIAVGQMLAISILALTAVSSSILVSEAGRDIAPSGVLQWYLIQLFLSLSIAAIAAGVSAAGVTPWICVACSAAVSLVAVYAVHLAVGFDFTLINLVGSLGALVRGGGPFPRGVIIVILVISFGFQVVGGWRLAQRDF